MMKRILLSLLLTTLLTACSDDVSSTYSTKYQVMAGFVVPSYPELMAVVNNAGQFGYVRQSGSQILMWCQSGSNSYNMDALSKDFKYGLGGIIIGTQYDLALRVYDLACPNCDRNDRRLTLLSDGTAKCANCGIIYDLNNDGVILDRGNGLHSSPRGLYRYRIIYTEANGRVQVYN